MFKPARIKKYLKLKILSLGRSNKAIFDNVYQDHKWGTNEDGISSSGKGSLPENTIDYESFIVNYINENNINSLLDIGCGDFQVSERILQRLDEKKYYIGADVSQVIIKRNRELYENESTRFIELDASKDEYPETDLITIREVMQHLPNNQVKVILSRLKELAPTTHILITNTVSKNPEITNADIPPGSASRAGMKSGLWLDKPPFNCRIEEVFKVPHKSHDTILITSRLLGYD